MREVRQIKVQTSLPHMIVQAVLNEVERAMSIHSEWPMDIVHAAAIVAEESGELVKSAINVEYHKGDIDETQKEAIQTAAVSLRFLYGLAAKYY